MYKEEFHKIFELCIDAIKPGKKVYPGCQPINFSNPADMAAIKLCLGIGGADKVWNFFTSDLLHHWIL